MTQTMTTTLGRVDRDDRFGDRVVARHDDHDSGDDNYPDDNYRDDRV